MKVRDRLGEMVRGFQVILRGKGKTLQYHPIPGEEALEAMRELKRRGFEVTAYTTGWAGEEYLTLGEMEEIYGSA